MHVQTLLYVCRSKIYFIILHVFVYTIFLYIFYSFYAIVKYVKYCAYSVFIFILLGTAPHACVHVLHWKRSILGPVAMPKILQLPLSMFILRHQTLQRLLLLSQVCKQGGKALAQFQSCWLPKSTHSFSPRWCKAFAPEHGHVSKSAFRAASHGHQTGLCV